MLLISDKAMQREVRELGIGKIIILSEGVHPPELDQYPSVYKYSVLGSDVIREVMSLLWRGKVVKDPVDFPAMKTNPWTLLVIFHQWAESENILCA